MTAITLVTLFCNNRDCAVASVDYDASTVVEDCDTCHSPESAVTRELLRCSECDDFLSKLDHGREVL